MQPRKRLRFADHDYTAPGAYFVTLVTVHRQCLFGRVSGTEIQLSSIGEAVASKWQDLPLHYPGLTLDEFVVMPNHLHGVIVLEFDNRRRLPDIIRTYKTFTARDAGQPIWQRSFHDRIVRGEAELARVREYIANNPAEWAMDEENPDRQ